MGSVYSMQLHVTNRSVDRAAFEQRPLTPIS